MSGHTPWREIKHKKDQRTERTAQGFEVPVPKRRDVLANLRKVAKVPGKGSGPRGPQK